MKPKILPFDLAFIRWSASCRRWHDLIGAEPLLEAFLAGWFCRCIGVEKPANVGQFSDSFNTGWREADEQIVIESRKK